MSETGGKRENSMVELKRYGLNIKFFPPVLMSVSQNGQRIICMLNPARGGRRLLRCRILGQAADIDLLNPGLSGVGSQNLYLTAPSYPSTYQVIHFHTKVSEPLEGNKTDSYFCVLGRHFRKKVLKQQNKRFGENRTER